MIIAILTAAALNLTPLPQPVTTITVEPIHGTIIKPTFKEKHPKLYKAGRKVRVVCIFLKPVADVASDLAVVFFKAGK